MNWYYVDAGQQAGPVDDALLASLVSSGKIQPDTLVWHEGMTDWVSYSDSTAAPVPPLAPEIGTPPAPGSAAAGGLICCECGRAFAPDQVIRHADKWVCATCKPIFLQRLREGASLSGLGRSFQGTVTEADLLARDYEVDIGGCLSQGWQLFKNDWGIIMGASVLVFLALMAARFIPLVGGIVYILLSGPLLGGLWYFYIKKVRGQEANLGDAFGGFGPRLGQLLLTKLIPALIVIGMVFVVMIPLIPALIATSRGTGRGFSGLSNAMLIPVGLVAILFMVAMTYLFTCWTFALPLVADKGLQFWPALQLSRRVVNKHWWMTFWLLFVCYFLGCVGIFAFCFGVLVTGPVAFAAVNYHYEKVFGDLMPQG